MLKQKPSRYVVFFLSLLLYIAMGYNIPRYETFPLLACYFALFLLYLRMLQWDEYRFWMAAAVVFRASLLFCMPALSDDFYRFIWDGRLLAEGLHPFAHVPSWYMTQASPPAGLDAELFNNLNSKETFTIYPPVAQLIFWLSAVLSDGSIYRSVLVMKVITFAFETGTLWLFPRVARQFNIPVSAVLLYALNPLVILELTGNLHHEGIMVFFLLAGLLLLGRRRYAASAVAWSFSICSKLIPLMFLPLLLRYTGWKRAAAFWLVTGAATLLLFWPLLNMDVVRGLSTSLGYYFQRFEFNASLYYLVRAVGYATAGFNIIHLAGPVLGVGAMAVILKISLGNFPPAPDGQVDTTLFTTMLWCLLAWFLSTTILHPWYIITLLAISVFTPYRFTVVWTAMIFLTYQGYTQTGFHEDLRIIALEYVVVIGYLLYESLWVRRRILS